MKIWGSFTQAIEAIGAQLRDFSYPVSGTRWQSSDVSDKPEMTMREVLHQSFGVQVWSEDLDVWRTDIQPNLPWADDHFEERVSGIPWNPGEQWKNWPYAHSADRFRTEGEKFSHTYMERYWPRYAGHNFFDENWKKHGIELLMRKREELLNRKQDMEGIRYDYGDLNDVLNHLAADPLTRQAFLPVWFPEDTGVVHGERVPCTLGYHFILRNGYLHHTYYIRSCDFVRHFRDDLYLSLRLNLWVLDRLRERERTEVDQTGYDPDLTLWHKVKPGLFVFHCVSMHCFLNDALRLWPDRFAKKSLKT